MRAEAQASDAGFASVDEYIASLIRGDTELEIELQRGLDSGPSVPLTPELLNDIKRSARQVDDFVRLHRLESAVASADALIREHFTVAGDLEYRVSVDPEIDDQWLVVRVPASGNIRESYRQYKDEWLRQVSREVSGKIRISPVVG